MNKDKFLEVFGEEHKEEYFSPGRVNLIGEHIDYNGGSVLPMAINFGTYGLVAKRNDKKIKLYSTNFEDVGLLEFDIDNFTYKKEDEWINYAKGVVFEILKDGHGISNGFNILVTGTIPNGSGLSSSASLEVLIAKIIVEQNNLEISDEHLAVLCQKAENNFIGVNCGIMDQFIIATAKKGFASLINTDKLEYEFIKLDLKDNVLVVINSNKKRGLVDSKYNERRESCKAALEKAQEKFDINNLCELNLIKLKEVDLDELEFKRAKHVVQENERVKVCMKYLQEEDLYAFGKILNSSHKSLKKLYEVSCEELDFIVDKSQSLGALGARMTGAGFGGCVISIFPKHLENVIDTIKEEYFEKFNLELEYYVVRSEDKAKKIK